MDSVIELKDTSGRYAQVRKGSQRWLVYIKQNFGQADPTLVTDFGTAKEALDWLAIANYKEV